MKLLIIVTGLPGSGKTSLAIPLAVELGVSLLSKDVIQETLFDHLKPENREASRRLNEASYAVLLEVARVARGAVVEGFWRHKEDTVALSQLCAPLLELYCDCPPRLAMERYRLRAPTRHPGHFEEEVVYDESEVWFKEAAEPLHVGRATLRVDTTKPVDIEAVAFWVRGHAGE